MNIKAIAGLAIAIALTDAGKAEESQWYGSARSGYLFADGDATLIGTTSSVYGGFPVIGMDDGGQGSIALGRLMPNGWRIEAELGFLDLDTSRGSVTGFDDRSGDVFRLDGSIDSTVLMFNTLVDISTASKRFTPYLKAGIGIARNDASAVLDVDYNSAFWEGTPLEGESEIGITYPDAFETSFAWNFGLGVRTALTDQFLLALEYGFIDLGDAATGIDENNDWFTFSDLTSQQLMLGLHYQF